MRAVSAVEREAENRDIYTAHTGVMYGIYGGYVGIYWGVHRGYLGIMKEKLEATIYGLGLYGLCRDMSPK